MSIGTSGLARKSFVARGANGGNRGLEQTQTIIVLGKQSQENTPSNWSPSKLVEREAWAIDL